MAGRRNPAALAAFLLLAAGPAAAKEEQKVVIPFDFVSKFDNGRYGQMVGEEDLEETPAPGRLRHSRVDARRARHLPAERTSSPRRRCRWSG